LKATLGDAAGSAISAEEWYNRGQIHNRNGDFQEAIDAYNNSVNMKPAYVNDIPAQYREALLKRMSNLQQTTDNTKAMMTVQLRDHDSEAVRNLAELFKKLQEEQIAIIGKANKLLEKNDAKEDTSAVDNEMTRVEKQMLELQQEVVKLQKQQEQHSKLHEQHIKRLDQHEQKLFDLETQTNLLVDLSAKGQATVDMIKSTLFTNIKLQAEHKQEVDTKLSLIVSEVAKGKAQSDLVQHMLKDINKTVKEHGVLLEQHEQKLFDLETQTNLLVDLSAKGQATVDMIKSTLFTNIKLQAEHKQEVDMKLSIIVSEVAKGKAKSDLVQHMLKDINDTVKEHGILLEKHEQKLLDLETQTELLIDLNAKGQATVDLVKSTLFTNIKLQAEHKQEVDMKLSIIVSEVAKGKAKSDLVQQMLKDINETVKEHGTRLVVESHEEQQH